jgi:hypothetical protein
MGNVIVDWIRITEVRELTDCFEHGTETAESFLTDS